MIFRSNISEDTLPKGMDTPNALSVHYKTNLLIPSLGPVTYWKKVIRPFNDYVDIIFRANQAIENVKAYEKRYNEIPKAPDYNEKIHIPLITDEVISRGSSKIKKSINNSYLEVIRNLNNITEGDNATNEIGSNDIPRHVDQLADKCGSTTTYNNLINAAGSQEYSKKDVDRLISFANLSKPDMSNYLLEKTGVINENENAIETNRYKELADKEWDDRIKTLADYTNDVFFGGSTSENIEISSWAKQIVKDSIKQNSNIDWKISDFNVIEESFARLAQKLFTERVFLPDTDSIQTEKEWAFQRHEKLVINLGTPVFRGPLNARSLTPKSSLKTIKEKNIEVTQTVYEAADQLSIDSRLKLETSLFRQSLENLTEAGITDGNQFERTQNVNEMLSEERRTRIQETIRSISKSNENESVRNILETQSEQYFTEGKDDTFATTELSYQIILPTTVKVFWEEIGITWSPELTNPFLSLQEYVNRSFVSAFNEYYKENHVLDPLEPIVEFETKKHTTSDYSRWVYNTEDPIVRIEIEQEIQLSNNQKVLEDEIKVERENQHKAYNPSFGATKFSKWYEKEKTNHIRLITVSDVNYDSGLFKASIIIHQETKDYGNVPEEYWINQLRTKFRLKIPIGKFTDDYVKRLRDYRTQYAESASRKAAINVRANQYAKAKRDELIRKWENMNKLQELAFDELVRDMQIGENESEWNYWRNILYNMFNWSEAHIDFEPAKPENIQYYWLAPDHFMNSPKIRYFLPIKRSAENTFFNIIGKAHSIYSENIEEIQNRVNDHREALINSPGEVGLLDEFDSEIVIGNHTEAILSKYAFKEIVDE